MGLFNKKNISTKNYHSFKIPQKDLLELVGEYLVSNGRLMNGDYSVECEFDYESKVFQFDFIEK